MPDGRQGTVQGRKQAVGCTGNALREAPKERKGRIRLG